MLAGEYLSLGINAHLVYKDVKDFKDVCFNQLNPVKK